MDEIPELGFLRAELGACIPSGGDVMPYVPGRFPIDEAMAQLAREYVSQLGTDRAAVRAAKFERLAESAQAECLAESFARTAEAIRDAIENYNQVRKSA